MTSSRPLLIPHKRPLFSSTTGKDINKSKTSCNKTVAKALNSSAVAAETRMKKPISYPLHSDENADEGQDGDELQYLKSEPIEVAFAMAPQPFLDPPTWEAMLKRARDTANASNNTGTGNRRDDHGSVGPSSSETADQRRLRREREAEYGSMAIRGRSSNIDGWS
ncbi:hypothetical protein N7478_003365 [Penicillium angulare]|uniref:uncharacterized protein n=1 Tax=Penicillium angulare TaxID=116970 RepID=UPI0025412A10|nr:uncharacterized protein N7478_003365 [Penicillium angulare]KAJ5287679.1 hypothetical protein N7478_003365 [Penicillium angulare]